MTVCQFLSRGHSFQLIVPKIWPQTQILSIPFFDRAKRGQKGVKLGEATFFNSCKESLTRCCGNKSLWREEEVLCIREGGANSGKESRGLVSTGPLVIIFF